MADDRVELILAAFETTLAADGTFDVLRAPMDALNDKLQQIPAACIFMGPEEPRGEDGFEVIGSYDGMLTVYVDIWEQASRETNIESKLLELRKKVYIALMQSTRLGLSFVYNLSPVGTDAPELSSDGQAISGMLRTSWLAEYRTSVTDPSA